MGKVRIIILGWHFKNNITFNVNGAKYNWTFEKNKKTKNNEYTDGELIEFKKYNHSYHIYLFAHQEVESETDIKDTNDKIENIIKDETNNEILIYLHDEPWDPKKHFTKYQKPNKQNVVVQIRSGASKPIYGDEGILEASKNNFTNENITELPWDDFWDELFINLEEKKNKLIQIWLPLAIDIQGLSEVKEKNKRQEYFSDIKEYYKNNKIDQSDIKEISEIFENENIKKQIKKCTQECNNILKKIKSNQEIESFYNNFITKEKPKEKPFPSLLQKLVEKIDQQIDQD